MKSSGSGRRSDTDYIALSFTKSIGDGFPKKCGEAAGDA
jgi:hypothetical protein